ncbi:ThuA domain-containing protein [Fontisphaera persica]|uniref:ThuA domain-containing protein n=1 Tax=Fontisphaera persica TaxID=2974023 RepID=UPI0024BF594E|nr:ThuA domain-containing protein [Fontisphaera persica]WCJ61092.1 ThuA domain-containing protein [Fontisphaera persica]
MKITKALTLALCAASLLWAVNSPAAERKIVLLAGTPSHGPGEHEHNAGCLLLGRLLNQMGGVKAVVHTNGWPKDMTIFDGADAVFIYCDGGGGHMAVRERQRLTFLGELMKRGVGFGCCHYAVEVPKDNGGPEFLNWMGGYFETHWSVNPHWDADFKVIPKHPITDGVRPFKIRDEWYFHMRFQEGMKGVTPILSAVAPPSTMNRPDGPHSGNPAVREAVAKGEPQHVMWAYERPDGGRGFGFTGGHFHNNWGHDDFRKVVLNAILWIAKAPIPPGGVQSVVTPEDLKQNLDPKGRK